MQVTCGTVLKLKHASNAAQLHSHEIAYGSGSGQQSVTGNPSLDDAGSYWVVQPAEVLLHLPFAWDHAMKGSINVRRELVPVIFIQSIFAACGSFITNHSCMGDSLLSKLNEVDQPFVHLRLLGKPDSDCACEQLK